MHWIEIIIGLFVGGFLGIILMSALVIGGRENENMEKYFIPSTDKEIAESK